LCQCLGYDPQPEGGEESVAVKLSKAEDFDGEGWWVGVETAA